MLVFMIHFVNMDCIFQFNIRLWYTTGNVLPYISLRIVSIWRIAFNIFSPMNGYAWGRGRTPETCKHILVWGQWRTLRKDCYSVSPIVLIFSMERKEKYYERLSKQTLFVFFMPPVSTLCYHGTMVLNLQNSND